MGTLRDAILAAEDLPREQVQTDEWAPFGAPFVLVRGLSAAERETYERSLMTSDDKGRRIPDPNAKNVRTNLIVQVVLDPETGERLFTGKGDAEALGKKSAAVIIRIWDKARELSGMVEPEEDEENPSKGDQEDSNSSDSPTLSE